MSGSNISTDTASLLGQREIRIQKVEKLKKLGIDPYPSNANRTNSIGEIVAGFDIFENKTVTVSGRLMTLRDHGHIVFGDLRERTGKIQLYIKDTELSSLDLNTQTLGFSEIELLDIGDIVEATGAVTKTKRGEISILVKGLKLLTKSLRPLPEKWSGIKDKETIFRQ